jgi:hypothetical protein
MASSIPWIDHSSITYNFGAHDIINDNKLKGNGEMKKFLRNLKRPAVLGILVTAVVSAGVTAVAIAAIPDCVGMIIACYNNITKSLRLSVAAGAERSPAESRTA